MNEVERPYDDGGGQLEGWLAMEVMRARAAFHDMRRQEEEESISRGHRKSGPRVKRLLRCMEKVGVGLVDSTTAATRSFQAPSEAVARARETVQSFLDEIGQSVVQLAVYVDPHIGGGDATRLGRERTLDCKRVLLAGFDVAIAAAQATDPTAGSALDSPEPSEPPDTGKFGPGRPKGAGSYEALDQPVIEEIRALIQARKHRSAWSASADVWKKTGGASEDAVRRRLSAAYNRQFRLK